MAFNMGSLVFRMAADVATLQKDISHAKRTVQDFTTSITRSFQSIVGISAAIMVGKQFIEMADAITLADARLKLVTKTTEEFQEAQRESYRIAQANMAGLVQTQTLYQRLAVPVRELGGGMKEVTAITDAFASALRVSGATVMETSGAILQFSQAMQAGRLNGDEFRSLSENSPRFMRALADGMGVPIAALKEMSKQGKLTTDVIGKALIKELEKLREEAAKIPLTVGGTFTQLKNDAYAFTKIVNETVGASGGLVSVLQIGAGVMEQFGRALQDANREMGSGREEYDLLSDVLLGVGRVIETLVVLFANLGYVGKTVAGEIAVRWSQFKLHMKAMNADTAAEAEAAWEESRKMGEDWAKQSEENRKAIDKFSAGVIGSTERVLKSRDALQNHSLSAKENANDLDRLAARAGIARMSYANLQSKVQAATDEQKRAAEAAAQLRKSLLDDVAALEMNAAGTDKLSAAQKLMLKIGEALRDNKIELKEAEKQQVFVRLQLVHATKEAAEREEELRKESDKSLENQLESLDAIKKEVEEQRKANAALGRTTDQQEQYNIALAETKLAKLELMRITPELSEAEERAIQAQIDAQKELIDVMREGAGKRAAIDAAEETKQKWQEVARDIEQALTDAMVNGWESGKSFFKSIGDWIVNYFKTFVARGIAQALMGAIGSGLSSAASAFGGGGSGGSGFNLLSMLSSGSSIAAGGGIGSAAIGTTMLGTFGSLGAGFMSGISGAGSMAAVSGLFANGSFAAGGGMALGMAAPYLAAAYGLYRLISGVGTGRQRGEAFQEFSAMSGGGDTISGFWGGNIKNPAGGSWGGGHYDTQLRGVISAVDAVAKSFGGELNKATQFAQFASWSPDGLGALIAGQVKGADGRALYDYSNQGSNADMQQRLAAMAPGLILAGLQDSALPARIKEYFNSVSATSVTQETLDKMVAAASAAHALAESFKDLGGPFAQLTTLSVDARIALGNMAGGIESLLQKMQGYYQEFYLPEEQDAMALLSASKQLKDAGIDMSQFGGATEDEVKRSYRNYVEGLDLTTEDGQKKFAALMNSASGFASGADLLASTGLTLDELVRGAPDFDVAPVVTAQQTTNTLIGSTNGILEAILSALQKGGVFSINVSVDQPATVEVFGGGN